VASDSTRELLVKLLKRRDELRIESEALDKLIEAYTSLSHLTKADVETSQLDLWKARHSRKAKTAYVGELLAEVRRLIISEGRPMNRGELVRRLESVGYLIDGSDKAKVLGTNIWRSGKFAHINGHGYWPRDIERPTL